MSHPLFHPAPNEDQSMILDLVASFARDDLNPQGEAIDHAAELPVKLENQLAEMGLLAIPIAEDKGGAGFDFVSYALSLVELAKASATVAMHVVNQTNLFLEPLADHVSEHPAFLDVASGQARGALALNEDGGSWHEAQVQMDCSQGILNGKKTWVEGGARAKWLLVGARDSDGLSFFVLNADREGIVIDESPGRLGLRTIPGATVHFHDVKIDQEDRVGNSTEGTLILNQLRSHGMVATTAIACGLMVAARDAAALYATERIQFRRAIANFEAIRQRLATSEIGHGAAINLLLSCARIIDDGNDCTALANIAKVVATKNAVQATNDALQVYGGYGVSQEYPAERYYRDACCLPGLFGGNDATTQEIATSIIPQT